jgi:hypothetical protein
LECRSGVINYTSRSAILTPTDIIYDVYCPGITYYLHLQLSFTIVILFIVVASEEKEDENEETKSGPIFQILSGPNFAPKG